MRQSMSCVKTEQHSGMESRKELMRNVPETENGYIKVPAIIENGEAGA